MIHLLDYVVPQCSEKNAWEEGKQWLGSLLRRANLRHNRIVYIPNLNLHHQYLQELYLDHNDITEIKGISTLRYLRVLSLSNNRLSSTKGLHPALEDHDSAEGGLFALEKLILSHNEITETPDLQGLPRLTELDLSHNRMKHLKSLSVCKVLQRLDLSSNEIENINELNHLMALKLLCKLNLSKSPIVEKEGEVFYRPRVLRRLQQIQHLDDDEVSAKEKVKALAMHGSELESRKEVFNKYLPGEQFTNCL
jgi:protein phosphatase 1 regulatory subunit 7